MQRERAGQTDQRDWFPKYRDGMKIIFNQEAGSVTSTNPILMATVSELVTLMLVKTGRDYQEIADIFNCSKSGVSDHMYGLRVDNHTENGNLFRKAKTLGLDNPLALRGLAIRIRDHKRRDNLLRRIDLVAQVLSQDLRDKRGEEPFGVFPPRELDLKIEDSWRNLLKSKKTAKKASSKTE